MSVCATSRSRATGSSLQSRGGRMPTVRILSGGAAQGLVAALAPQFEAETGYAIEGEFGAVGTMAAKLRSGAPVDLLVLTARLIGELAREGHVAGETSADVGVVQ